MTKINLTEADWFNSIGLTQKQLESTKQETVPESPRDKTALRSYLEKRYSFPFKSWDKYIQNQLTDAWDEYLKEGGLCNTVFSWRQKP